MRIASDEVEKKRMNSYRSPKLVKSTLALSSFLSSSLVSASFV